MSPKIISELRKTSLVTQFVSLIKWATGSSFRGSEDYWKSRYSGGKNSGSGSYGRLAEFKAEVLNKFVTDNKIQSVMEFGTGDGNQLKLATYPQYIGYDVSPDAVNLCKKMFSDDASKSFYLLGQASDKRAELTLSLDVLYHLIEDTVFHSYLERLFDSADRYVIIYAADSYDRFLSHSPHVKLREFTPWVKSHRPGWVLKDVIQNRFPYDPKDTENTSFADFYIYEKAASDESSSKAGNY